MVGIGTVLRDDPLLNTRLPEGGGRDPLRVVVDSRLRIDPSCRLLIQESAAQTLVATTSCADAAKIEAIRQAGTEVMIFGDNSGRVDLQQLWQELGRRNVQRLLLEGGATLGGEALREGLIDQMMIFIAPKLFGGESHFGIFAGRGCETLADAVALKDLRCEASGEDLWLTGELRECLPD